MVAQADDDITPVPADQDDSGGGSVPLRPGWTMRRFQFTSLQANSNKWYVYEIKEEKGTQYVEIVGRYGREGDKGQVKDYGRMHVSDFERMVRDRIRKGYVEVELHKVAVTPQGVGGVDTTTPEGRVVAYIFSEANETINTYLSTPVNALSSTQLDRGRAMLEAVRIGKLMNLDPRRMQDAIEVYYRTVPTKLPRFIDAQQLVDEFDLSEQENRLDQLEAALATYKAVQGGASQQNALGATITYLPPGHAWHDAVLSYVKNTAKGSRITVRDIFEVEIPAERAQYKTRWRGDPNKKLLFHGTRTANVRHILRSGLIVPRHAPNGRGLGDGVYFADQSAKSVNYCSARGYGSQMLMLVSEVALGKCFETTGGRGVGGGKKAGYDSIYSKAGGGYGYNEYLIYDHTRSTIRFLISFTV